MANAPITIIGEANFRNQLRRFGIKQDDRRRHMYLIGKTGMGKSVLLQNLAISDIHAGHGICFIDPHGDPSEELLEYIPPHRINDVVYINPADLDFPVAFNILESIDPKYRHLVASGLVAVFKKMWADSWGPRLEYILRNTILALLDFPSSTLLGVTRMLTDKQYRRKVVARITDPVVKSFWVAEFENYNEKFMTEAISPIQNKVGQFLSSAVIRNILGQTKSTINLNDAMDNQKIVILNLSKGKLGEDNSALLGAMMITKIQLAAMQRAAIAEEDRKDFYLYVDEFQNFATEAFATILSEARKYRLNLVVANQYITQMEETVSDAVFGNVGTMVCFRIGAADAEIFEKEFEPTFMMHDLVNLPKYNVYLKLMVDGVASRAFSAQTLPIIYERFALQDKVIAVSRERYGNPRAEVEDKIMRWSGVQVISAEASIADAAAMALEDEFGDNPAPVDTRVAPSERPQPAPASARPVAARPVASAAPRSLDRAPAPRPRFDDRPRQDQSSRSDRPERPRYDSPRDRVRDSDRRSAPRRDQRDQAPRPVSTSTRPQTAAASVSAPRPVSNTPASRPAAASSDIAKPAAPTSTSVSPAPKKEPIVYPREPLAPVEQQATTPTENVRQNTSPLTPEPVQQPAVVQQTVSEAPVAPAQPVPTPTAVPARPVAESFASTVKVILPSELEAQMRAQAKKKPGKKPVDPNRPMYKTKCDECEIPIEVPFVPDGSRPVLCQDCLPEYRSRMARMEEQRRAEQGEPALTPVPIRTPAAPRTSPRRTAVPVAEKREPLKNADAAGGSQILPGQTVRF